MGVITSAAIGAVGVGMSVAKTISEKNTKKGLTIMIVKN